MPAPITDKRERVLDALRSAMASGHQKDHGRVRHVDLMAATGLSSSTVSRTLAELRRDKLVTTLEQRPYATLYTLHEPKPLSMSAVAQLGRDARKAANEASKAQAQAKAKQQAADKLAAAHRAATLAQERAAGERALMDSGFPRSLPPGLDKVLG